MRNIVAIRTDIPTDIKIEPTEKTCRKKGQGKILEQRPGKIVQNKKNYGKKYFPDMVGFIFALSHYTTHIFNIENNFILLFSKNLYPNRYPLWFIINFVFFYYFLVSVGNFCCYLSIVAHV